MKDKPALYTVKDGQVGVSTLQGSLSSAMAGTPASQNVQPNGEASSNVEVRSRCSQCPAMLVWYALGQTAGFAYMPRNSFVRPAQVD